MFNLGNARWVWGDGVDDAIQSVVDFFEKHPGCEACVKRVMTDPRHSLDVSLLYKYDELKRFIPKDLESRPS
jgi:hypothetical protein